MAQERQPAEAVPATEQQDRGLFGLFGKKEEKHDEGQAHSQAAAQAPVHHDNPLVSHGNDKQEALHGKLHRTHSSSSSSSSDEDESGKKKEGGRKKKDLKEKIKEKLSGHHDDKNKKEEHGQGHEGVHKSEAEKKGVLEKIKEKLPGHHHKEGEEGHVARD